MVDFQNYTIFRVNKREGQAFLATPTGDRVNNTYSLFRTNGIFFWVFFQ